MDPVITSALEKKGVKVARVSRLEVPYPNVGYYVCESQDTASLWANFLDGKLEDVRDTKGAVQQSGSRAKCMLLDPEKLAYDVAPGENVIFLDNLTNKVIGGTISKLLDDDTLAEVVHELVLKVTNSAIRTARKEDSGRIVQVGYTAGSRSLRQLGWARNLKKTADTDEFLIEISRIIGLVWDKASPLLPPEVQEDYQRLNDRLRGLEMDAGMAAGRNENLQTADLLNFSLEVDGKNEHARLTTLAPASALCVSNYTRYMHNETNAHEFCVGYYPKRIPEGIEHGGNFFIAQYGIRIPMGSDQINIWKTQDHHGTSLQKIDPNNPKHGFLQSGIAFIVSTSLPGAIRQLGSDGKVSAEAANDIRERRSRIEVAAEERSSNPPPFYSGKDWTKRALMEEVNRRIQMGVELQVTARSSN